MGSLLMADRYLWVQVGFLHSCKSVCDNFHCCWRFVFRPAYFLSKVLTVTWVWYFGGRFYLFELKKKKIDPLSMIVNFTSRKVFKVMRQLLHFKRFNQ